MALNEEPEADASGLEREKMGDKLRKAREYLGLSQEEVAKVVGIPRAAISLIESGKRKVDTFELKKFATVYQRSVSYFTEESPLYTGLPKEVEHLARAVANLSTKDQEELFRFAEFLKSRTLEGKKI